MSTPDQCPKCNCKKFDGPRYVNRMGESEHLQYMCSRCGYKAKVPCADSQNESADFKKYLIEG